jgi:hypothetical protein
VAVGDSGGIAIGRKAKVSLEWAGVPEALARIKKSGALRTALHRKKMQVMGWSKKVTPQLLTSWLKIPCLSS